MSQHHAGNCRVPPADSSTESARHGTVASVAGCHLRLLGVLQCGVASETGAAALLRQSALGPAKTVGKAGFGHFLAELYQEVAGNRLKSGTVPTS